MQRNSVIDIAKGIGIILVILGHLVSYEDYISSYIFSFHMPLFFFITGYLTKDNSDWKDVERKLLQFVLVFIEVSLIGLCFTLIIPSWRKNLSLISIFYEIAWNAQPELLHVGQIWYLAALFFASIFFYIMLKFCKNKSIIMITILGLIMFILSYMTTFIPIRIYILNHILRIPLKIDTAFAAVLLIVMGYVMKHYNLLTKLKELSKIFKIMIFMVSACVLAIIVKYNGHVNIANCLYNNPVM